MFFCPREWAKSYICKTINTLLLGEEAEGKPGKVVKVLHSNAHKVGFIIGAEDSDPLFFRAKDEDPVFSFLFYSSGSTLIIKILMSLGLILQPYQQRA